MSLLWYSVVLDASSISFQYYTDGIYYDTDCNQSGLNHAMLVVGYGTDSSSGVDYWILKNRFPMCKKVFIHLILLQLGQVMGSKWLYEDSSWQEYVWYCNCSDLSTCINPSTQ